ncbi:MAG: hypothetical protein V4627_11465 [Pseudomonadota bacterium]
MLSPKPQYWIEIDLLRALAAALMIINHSGVAWFQEVANQRFIDMAMTFIGGLAPVVFFFATGLGSGIKAANTGDHQPITKTWTKVLILFMADSAMWLSSGRSWGFDFLAFIGLSTLVLDLVYRTSHPRAYLMFGITLSLILRFVVAPILSLQSLDGMQNQAMHFVLGDIGVPGVSYPLCPWLVFPLLGALVGDIVSRNAIKVRNSRNRLSLILGLTGTLGLGLCLYLEQKGMLFFRWGTLSFAYTVFSVSGLLLAVSLVLFLVAQIAAPSISALSLPGAASLIVVPVHYACVAIIYWALPTLVQQNFPIASIVTLVFVIYISKNLNQQMMLFVGVVERRGAGFGLVFAAFLATAACGLVSNTSFSLTMMIFSQLLACSLFLLTSRTSNFPIRTSI